jgi:hypothetical protein
VIIGDLEGGLLVGRLASGGLDAGRIAWLTTHQILIILHSLGVTGLHATAFMKEMNLHATRSTTKFIQMRRDVEHSPKNI